MTQFDESDNRAPHRELVLDLGDNAPTLRDAAQRLRALADVLTTGGRVDFDWRIREHIGRELLSRFVAESDASAGAVEDRARRARFSLVRYSLRDVASVDCPANSGAALRDSPADYRPRLARQPAGSTSARTTRRSARCSRSRARLHSA